MCRFIELSNRALQSRSQTALCGPKFPFLTPKRRDVVPFWEVAVVERGRKLLLDTLCCGCVSSVGEVQERDHTQRRTAPHTVYTNLSSSLTSFVVRVAPKVMMPKGVNCGWVNWSECILPFLCGSRLARCLLVHQKREKRSTTGFQWTLTTHPHKFRELVSYAVVMMERASFWR